MTAFFARTIRLLTILTLAPGLAATAAAADLTLTGVSANRTDALAGEQVAVSCGVTNSGTQASGTSRLKYYFSSDETLDSSDSYLNYDNVGALAPGQTGSETANIRVPSGTADGSYFVLFVADYDNEVAEVDETNNIYALALIVGPVVRANGPDLVIGNVVLGASQANPNEVIAAGCTVDNQGNEAATVETRLKYYLSTDTQYDAGDTYLNYDRVEALEAGGAGAETANLRVPSGTTDGVYYVLFVADQTDTVSETDELNNVHAEPLVVGNPLADLTLSAVTVLVPTVRAGETIDVSATAHNVGAVAAPSARLVYYLSTDTTLDAADKQLSYDSVGALGAGDASPESASLRVSSATDGGNYYLLFVLDADGAVVESDEDNNVQAIAIEVVTDDPNALLPDLILTNASLGAAIVEADAQLAVSVTVENQGVAVADASRLKYYFSVDAVFDDSDAYLNYDAIGILAPGATSAESSNLRIPALTADGDYYILFVADSVKDVAEQLESNNVVAVAFSVGSVDTPVTGDNPTAALPDLRALNAVLDTTEVMAGARAALSCEIVNVGAYPAAASRVKYYLSLDAVFDATDDYVGYDNVPALAPGETSAEKVTPLIDPLARHGTWYLLMVVDAVEEVPETFESNNVTSIAVQVVVDDPSLDAADLFANAGSLDKTTVGAGFKLDINVVVHNQGSQPAVAPRVKYYLSSDARLDSTDQYLAYRQLGDVPVSAQVALTADVRIPVTAAAGAAFILVVVDSERANVEQYESNNLHAIAVTIGVDDGPDPVYPYNCPTSVFTDQSLLGQSTVASLNALHLGWNNSKDMTALACIVSHYDLVGLVEIDAPQGVTDLEVELERLTGEPWSSHVSATAVGNSNGWEYYAFVWRDAEVSMTGSLGFFDDPEDLIKREPYGANFSMGAFDFTYVVFHLQYGSTISTRRAEAAQLLNIYNYFQTINGTESDVLIGGDFNLPSNDPAFTLLGVDGIRAITDPDQPTSIGANGLANSFDNIFFNADVSELIGSGAHDYTNANCAVVNDTVTDHIPVWAAFDTTIDDD